MDRQASGDLTHGREQRQRTVVQLNGFVGDSGDFAIEQRAGDRFSGGEMEISEKDQTRTQQGKLGFLGLFDLHDQVGLAPDFFGAVDDGRAGGLIVGVGETAAAAGIFLNQYLMVARDESGDSGRSDGDAVFFGFDFFRDADDHA